MEITKKEFIEFFETLKTKYDAEIRIRFEVSEVMNFPNDKNSAFFLFVSLRELFKKNYDLKLTDPKSGINYEAIELLTGMSKEKIIYIRENYNELFNKYKRG